MGARLNAYIAQGSRFSRRKADTLILEGNVRVNDAVVRVPYYRVQDTDRVTVNDQDITPHGVQYVALHKPVGYTCTCSDRYADRKVTDLLPVSLRHLYPVGRLDKNSRGLLLMTNDGDFCNRMTHPRFEVEKEYLVTVAPLISPAVLQRLNKEKGLLVDRQKYRLASVSEESRGQDRSVLRVIAREGKKRHLRVVFSTLGYTVMDLQRVRIGSLCLGDLKEGAFRFLLERETCALMRTE